MVSARFSVHSGVDLVQACAALQPGGLHGKPLCERAPACHACRAGRSAWLEPGPQSEPGRAWCPGCFSYERGKRSRPRGDGSNGESKQRLAAAWKKQWGIKKGQETLTRKS